MKLPLAFSILTAAVFLTAAEPAKPAAAVKPAAAATQTPVLSSLFQAEPNPAAYADQTKAAALIEQRSTLVTKIHAERKRLLTEDAAAKKLREEILLLNRKLASLLESKKSMIELNSQLMDVDLSISRLKPAPAVKPEQPEPAKAEKE